MHPIGRLLVLTTFVLTISLPAAVVHVFDNPLFVDSDNQTYSESDNVQAGLRAMGHTVVLFTNVPTAIAPNTILLFPEFETGDLAPTLTAAQRAGLSNFVMNGGSVIVHGAHAAPLRSTRFFEVFGLNLTCSQLSAGTSSTQTSLAIGTPFAGAPTVVPNNDGCVGIHTSTLPSGARGLYQGPATPAPTTTVATIPRGVGQLIFLGWDWYNARPVGTQDGGWLALLNAAVAVAGTNLPPSAPVIFEEPVGATVFLGGTARFYVGAFGSSPLFYQWTFNNTPIDGATNAELVLTAVTANDAGRYVAIVSNSVGVANSAKATLRVLTEPGEVFRVDAFLADNSRIVAHGALSGDDRGGIAVSRSRVFYAGDSGTATYNLDLGDGRTVDRAELPVSDLQTETMYALGNGTNLFPGGTVTSLIELGTDTGQPTGTILALSTPIPFAGGGIFAGYGRIVLHNGSDVYNIQLPSGDVIHLGAIAMPPHATCEHYAFWGVAEFFDGAVHLAYVRDSQTIARTRAPDGLTSVVSTFSSLSDMCSITVAPGLERWYFHHEGTSQFGGVDESLGYAGAEFFIPSLPATPPRIRQQPQSQGAFVGGTAQFSVRATGADLQYQWLFNGGLIAGANTNHLVLTGVTTNEAGVYAVIVSNSLGAATSSNAVLVVSDGGEPFSITSLSSNNSLVVDHNQLTGDDRGGIAVSSTHVFYSGDEATARFLLADLSGGARATYLEVPVSDLRSETVYVLGNGATPVAAGGTVTTLIHVDGQTGAQTGARITLSQPIVLESFNVGIFAGYGRIVIHSGTRVYNVDMPSGLVFDLGPMPVPAHSGCEHWAHWGVAEFFNGSVHLVYVRDSLTIARARVPDGLTTTVADFINLSDMCSISVSVPYGRWYFHYEGSAQFGGSAETVGFADATFSVVVPPRPPQILRHPSNTAALEGGNARFDVLAIGSGLTYQWLFNGSPLVGATNRQFTITGVTDGHLGTYAVIVSNAEGSVTSSNAMLTIASPPGSFRITSLTTNNSRIVDHNDQTGDDRGGIAASATHLFVSGDFATARLNLGDLGGAAALVDFYDLLTCDLASRTVYTLASGGVPLLGAGVVDSLMEIHGSTGELTGHQVILSEPIPLLGSVGLFAGHGRIAIHNGSRVYDIIMPAGAVIDRGAMPQPQHAGCEHFAHWGVAEYFNNALHLAFIRNNRTIIRARVPDGQTNTIATFNNLGDMCSFTVAVPSNRWYFHYEGGAQFGFGQEVAGYATATFDFPNSPPLLSTFTNATILEDTVYSVPFRVFDFETPPDQLTFFTGTSNPNLVPRTNIVITGTGTNRTLTVTPALNRFGGASITISVRDASGGSTLRSFFLTVRSVDDAPVPVAQSIELDEDTFSLITLQAIDPEGSNVTYTVTTSPLHGALSGASPNLVYTPRANYFGPDSFAFTASDGVMVSSEATVSITVRPVEDPPQALSQDIALNEDASAAITLSAIDPDGTPLTFSVTTPPQHGVLSGAPPNLVYTPEANYSGSDAIAFRVTDGVSVSDAAVSITVLPVNDAPTAVAQAWAPTALSTNGTNLTVLSLDNIGADVILDASGSTDTEGDALQFLWTELGSDLAFASGPIVTNFWGVGQYQVVLQAYDGTSVGTTMLNFEIVTAADAAAGIVLLVGEANLGRRNQRPMVASLKAAMLSFEKGDFTSARNQLRAFQNKVGAQIAPFDAELAARLTERAQQLIDAFAHQ